MEFDILKLKNLTEKYVQNVPRYTSYPTVLELTPLEDTNYIYNIISNNESTLSLYVHIPFCKSICTFCACNRQVSLNEEERDSYISYLGKELDMISRYRKPNISSIHIGGGSPSFLTSTQLEKTINLIENSINFLNGIHSEKSIELDPRTMTKEKAILLNNKGFQRISLGIQDFNPDVQRCIGRIQDFDLVSNTTQYIRDAGINNINFDLVYGLPKQNLISFKDTISKTISLKPNRIALYSFAYVPWKAKNQAIIDKNNLPTASEKIELFLYAVESLQNAGYNYVGLDHFALKNDPLVSALEQGYLQRNFMGYTSDGTSGVLALGASGISDISGTLYQNYTTLSDYNMRIEQNTLPVEKCYTRDDEDIVRSKLIELIMTHNIIRKDLYLNNFSDNQNIIANNVYKELISNITTLQNDGLIKLHNSDDIEITSEGRFFIRIIASLVDAKLKKYLAKRENTFSKGT